MENRENNGTNEIALVTPTAGFVGGPVLSLDKAVCIIAPQRPIHPAGGGPSSECKEQDEMKLRCSSTIFHGSTGKLILGISEQTRLRSVLNLINIQGAPNEYMIC